MIEQSLEKIGLTQGEIKVYLALLELGSTTTWNITKKSGVSGSKVYEILERLITKGLISHINKNNVRYFETADPSRILDYLNEKENTIKEEKIEIQKIIPQLILKQKSSTRSEAKIFYGLEGAKTAFEAQIKNLKKGDLIYGWGLTKQPESWEIYFNKREKARDAKGITHKSIINEQYKSLYNARKNLPNTYFRFFPKDLEMPTCVTMGDNKVAIYIITEENPLVILIESESAYKSFKKCFDLLWKSAKP